MDPFHLILAVAILGMCTLMASSSADPHIPFSLIVVGAAAKAKQYTYKVQPADLRADLRPNI